MPYDIQETFEVLVFYFKYYGPIAMFLPLVPVAALLALHFGIDPSVGIGRALRIVAKSSELLIAVVIVLYFALIPIAFGAGHVVTNEEWTKILVNLIAGIALLVAALICSPQSWTPFVLLVLIYAGAVIQTFSYTRLAYLKDIGASAKIEQMIENLDVWNPRTSKSIAMDFMKVNFSREPDLELLEAEKTGVISFSQGPFRSVTVSGKDEGKPVVTHTLLFKPRAENLTLESLSQVPSDWRPDPNPNPNGEVSLTRQWTIFKQEVHCVAKLAGPTPSPKASVREMECTVTYEWDRKPERKSTPAN